MGLFNFIKDKAKKAYSFVKEKSKKAIDFAKKSVEVNVHNMAESVRKPKTFVGRGLNKAIEKTNYGWKKFGEFAGLKSAWKKGENIGGDIVENLYKVPHFDKTLMGKTLFRRTLDKSKKLHDLKEYRKIVINNRNKALKKANKAERSLLDENFLKEIEELDKSINQIVPQKTKLQRFAEDAEFALDLIGNLTMLETLGTSGLAKTGVKASLLKPIKAQIAKEALKNTLEGGAYGAIEGAKEEDSSVSDIALNTGLGAGMGLLMMGSVHGVGKAGKFGKKLIKGKAGKIEEATVKNFKNINDVFKKSKTAEEFLGNVTNHKNEILNKIDTIENAKAIKKEDLNKYVALKKDLDEVIKLENSDNLISKFEKEHPKKPILNKTHKGLNDTQEVVLRNIEKNDVKMTSRQKETLQKTMAFKPEHLKNVATVDAVKEVSKMIDLKKFPKEARQGIAETIVENASKIQKQRRGVIKDERAIELARNIIADKKMKKGAILNEEGTIALGDALATSQKNVEDLMRKIKEFPEDGNKFDKDILKIRLENAVQDKAVLTASFMGNRAEAGRALHAQKIARKALDTGDIDLINAYKRDAGGLDLTDKEIATISKHLSSFGNDELAKFKYMRNLYKPTLGDKWDWFRYTNMLSGPGTHSRNILGNLGHIAYRVASKPAAVAADMAYSKMTGKQRAIYLKSIPKELVGMKSGAKEGMKKALFMMKNGFEMSDVANTDLSANREAYKGILPNVIGRGLQAMDIMFRSIASQGDLHSNAWTKAKNKGLKGDELLKEFQHLLDNPTKEMIAEAKRVGKDAVFQADLGEFGKLANKLRTKKFPPIILKSGKRIDLPAPGSFFVPFLKTPINIFKKGVEASPLGLLSVFRNGTQKQKSEALGRAITGSLALVPIAMMAEEGNISGKGPEDKALRAELYNSGWRPNSVKIGDAWIPYNNMIPLNIGLAAIGNYHDEKVYNNKGDLKPSDVATISMKVGASLLDTGYLQGLNNLVSAMDDPERYGKRLVENVINQHIPLSSFMGSSARAIDDVFRKPDTIIDGIKTRIPMMSKEVAPIVTARGEEAKRPGNMFTRMVAPFTASKSKKDDIAKEFEILNYAHSLPSKRVGGYKMNNKEYAEYSKERGKYLTKLTDKVIKSPGWEKLTSSEKIDILKTARKEIDKEMRPFVREFAVKDLEKELKGLDNSEVKKVLIDKLENNEIAEETVSTYLNNRK